jgi:hypothetical protein
MYIIEVTQHNKCKEYIDMCMANKNFPFTFEQVLSMYMIQCSTEFTAFILFYNNKEKDISFLHIHLPSHIKYFLNPVSDWMKDTELRDIHA